MSATKLWFALRKLLRRDRSMDELDDELRFHLEMSAQKRVEEGMDPRAARAAALRDFGGVDRARADCRRSWGLFWMENLARAARVSIRSLWRSPGFTLLAIGMLALGIGFSSSTFSVTNYLLLRTIPYPNGERLMRIFRVDGESDRLPHSSGNYLDIRASATTLEYVAAYWPRQLNVSRPGEPPIAENGLGATADFFNAIGMQPFIGRGFAPEEDQPGEASDVVLTHSYWMRQYGGDPEIVGQSLRVASQAYTVVGVMPPLFESRRAWGSNLEFIIPTTMWASYPDRRENKYFSIVARLKPNVSAAQAQSELDAIADRLAQDYPADNRQDGLRIADIHSANTSRESRMIHWLITALAALVLAIACANLAGVQIARAFAQSREFATSAALGASRRDLALPPLMECLALTAGGGLLGAAVAYAANRYLSRQFGESIPIDGRVIAFGIAITALTGLAFGLAPAWIAARRAASEGLKDSSRSATGSRKQQNLKRALIVGQLALALILASAAATFGLAVRSALQRDLGWRPGGATFALVRIPYGPFPAAPQRSALFQTLRERLAALPGTREVALAAALPVFGYPSAPIVVEDAPPALPGQEPVAAVNFADPSFFSTLKIRFHQGSNLSAPDGGVLHFQAIVNECMAKTLWPDESPIGKRLRLLQRGITQTDDWFTVVGMVGDVEMPANLGSPPLPMQLYLPMEHSVGPYFNLVVTSPLAPGVLIAAMRRAVAEIDRDIIMPDANSIESWMRELFASNDLMIASLAAFAFVGLCIALIGLYAIIAQVTQQRSREMGIRIALGASRGDVARLILLEAGWLVGLGALLGICGAFAVNGFYRTSFPGLPLPGAWLQVAIAIALSVVGLGAAYLPARRAGRVDPATALRAE